MISRFALILFFCSSLLLPATAAEPSTSSTQVKKLDPTDESSSVSPRKFGVDDKIGVSRGWYVWQKWNPETWEAEVTKDPIGGEVYSVRVLPWSTCYRYLVYGASPDDLLPGERVNIFFNPDERHSRGYQVSFQDEVCQMKGHYHIWEVLSVVDAPITNAFKARVLGGDKPLNKDEWDFTIDANCQIWHDGKVDASHRPKVGDRLYMTWCWRDGKRVAMLIANDASLEKIKAQHAEKVAARIARDGMPGIIDGVEGTEVRYMLFSNNWAQGNQLQPKQTVRLTRTTTGYRPTGETIAAQVVSKKNRGKYGSGVNDIVLQIADEATGKTLAAWPRSEVIRLIPDEAKK